MGTVLGDVVPLVLGLVGDIFPEDMGKGETEWLGFNPSLKSLAGSLTSWGSSGLWGRGVPLPGPSLLSREFRVQLIHWRDGFRVRRGGHGPACHSQLSCGSFIQATEAV